MVLSAQKWECVTPYFFAGFHKLCCWQSWEETALQCEFLACSHTDIHQKNSAECPRTCQPTAALAEYGFYSFIADVTGPDPSSTYGEVHQLNLFSITSVHSCQQYWFLSSEDIWDRKENSYFLFMWHCFQLARPRSSCILKALFWASQ